MGVKREEARGTRIQVSRPKRRGAAVPGEGGGDSLFFRRRGEEVGGQIVVRGEPLMSDTRVRDSFTLSVLKFYRWRPRR